MVGGIPLLLLVATHNGAKVQVVHYIRDEVPQVPPGKPVLQRRRHQEYLVGNIGAEGLAHPSLSSLSFAPIIPVTLDQNYYSDRLLGLGGVEGGYRPIPTV